MTLTGDCHRIALINMERTAKWTAITQWPAGTHGYAGALIPQVKEADAQAGGLPDLHGMQEAGGSSPLAPHDSGGAVPRSRCRSPAWCGWGTRSATRRLRWFLALPGWQVATNWPG